MRLTHFIGALAVATLAIPAAPAAAALLIRIDKSTQQMTVSKDGTLLYRWPVSTGVPRYDTPAGQFKPFRMEKDHLSKEWDNAPMPYSIFFTKNGHAIHGTGHSSIGRPASHGCVRLSVLHAGILWKLVKHEKMANTRIELAGQVPRLQPSVVARRKRQRNVDDDLTASLASPIDGRGWTSKQTYYERRHGYYYRGARQSPRYRRYRPYDDLPQSFGFFLFEP
jgi:L,D-transpeptidase catalytic domain